MTKRNATRVTAMIAAIAAHVPSESWSQATATLDALEVVEAAGSVLGVADTASEGSVGRKDLESRPAYRPGEILEAAPGLIVTQHSGEGKANQYFMRGINIDHGTDLAITVDGMPVNLRTHAHGQGYSDLNFLITDLVSGLDYRKGPYHADEGDFSAAGAVHLKLPDRLDHGVAQLSAGGFGYRRAMLADTPKVAAGNLLYALELMHNDGPWTVPDDLRKVNGMLRYAQGTPQNGFNVTAMAYEGRWNATNQIPERALQLGRVGRFDTLDATDGGVSSRYSLSAAWHRTTERAAITANAYAIRYRLNLWSNFDFLDSFNRSAQIEQRDQRVVSGFNARHSWFGRLGQREMENAIGLQARNDNIGAGLFNTSQRQRVTTTRDDHVVESSTALYYENRLQWTGWMRTIAGLRADYYWGTVKSDTPVNSGDVRGHTVNPKLSLVFGPWAKTEYYLNYGRGFRSNDLRGTTITVDPANPGVPPMREPLLVRVTGYEAGVRTTLVPRLESAISVFYLRFGSELLFDGNSGTTADTGRPSRRVGVEWSSVYSVASWLRVHADMAYTQATYTDGDPTGVGTHVPQAIEGVATLTAAIDNIGPYYGSVRLRYLGPHPLIEDNSVRAQATTLLSGRAGYKLDKKTKLQIDGYNLLNRQVNQVEYFYASRPFLTDPPGGVQSVHLHPAEPRSVRLTLITQF